jgi:Flagellar assembly protein T, C-terminal domain
MRAKLAAVCLSILVGTVGGSATRAQTTVAGPQAQPDKSYMYCAGFVTDKVPDDMRVISGEQSNYKVVFARGDYVFLNRGADKGVKVGDKFSVTRPEKDPDTVEWFNGQWKLLKEMGTVYRDVGQVEVVQVQAKTATAQVAFSCDYMQRGDVVRPFEERPAPPYKDAATFDHFAPVSGKPVGTVVAAYDFTQGLGRGNTMYINLGGAKNVKIGDYVRVFRNQGEVKETSLLNQPKEYQYKLFGFGSTPERYAWKDLPREVVGEGIVLNVSKNSSTVTITYNTSEIYTGDYVEIE